MIQSFAWLSSFAFTTNTFTTQWETPTSTKLGWFKHKAMCIHGKHLAMLHGFFVLIWFPCNYERLSNKWKFCLFQITARLADMWENDSFVITKYTDHSLYFFFPLIHMPVITVTLCGDAPKANKMYFYSSDPVFVEYQTIFEYRCLTCIAKIHKIHVFHFQAVMVMGL